MAQPDTKVYTYRVHHYTSNKVFVATLGTFHLYLPKTTGNFATGWYVRYGAPVTTGTNPLYTLCLAQCPDFKFICWPCFRTTANYDADNFENYFQNFQALQTVATVGVATGDFLLAENVNNGVCIAQKVGSTGGNAQFYTYTKQGFENGDNNGAISQLASGIFFCNANGSGETLGSTIGLVYNDVDTNGNPTSFLIVTFRGVTSTNNSIRIYEISNVASGNIDGFRAFFADGDPYYNPPYDDFPESGEDHGNPDPNQEDDDIDLDPPPDTNFTDAGLCRIYLATKEQLKDLADYIWTDSNFLQDIINHAKQLLENPAEAIISLGIVPCVPTTAALDEVKVLYIGTGVDMYPVIEQYPLIDCGSYTLKEMYGSALDYNPYTRVQLFLPYIGTVDLNTDEVMGKTLHIYYRIDVVTGVCCAYVKANSDILYQFTGHCALFQPITSADFSGYLNAVIAAAKMVASIATYGAAPEIAQTIAGSATPSISGSSYESRTTTRNPLTGRQILSGTEESNRITESPGASFEEVSARSISNTVGAVMNSKANVAHSGGFSGNSGFLGKRRPYLIIQRPDIANPKNYGKYNGYPCMMGLSLNDCSGFTQVQSIQLTGIAATNPELAEIATLLKSGVIL